MRKLYLPYIFITWALLSVATVQWFFQLVILSDHSDYVSNSSLITMQGLFVLYLFYQHIKLFLLTDKGDMNPHLQVVFLITMTALFIMQAWWLLLLLLICMHSFFIAEILVYLVQCLYLLAEKSKRLIHIYLVKKVKG